MEGVGYMQFVVTAMPWTDADGDRGRFTGQVDSSSVPNGTGTLEYDDGPVVEGTWKDGVLESTSDSSDDGNNNLHAGEGLPAGRQRKRRTEPSSLGVIPERQSIRGSLRSSGDLLHASHRDLSQDSHGDPSRYNAGSVGVDKDGRLTSPGSGSALESPVEEEDGSSIQSHREENGAQIENQGRGSRSDSERWSRHSGISDSIKEESEADIHRELSGNTRNEETAAELGRMGRRDSGREADAVTRGVPIDEVPVQEEVSSLRSSGSRGKKVEGIDAEFMQVAEQVSQQVEERRLNDSQKSAHEQSQREQNGTNGREGLRLSTRSGRSGVSESARTGESPYITDDDAPILHKSKSLKSAQYESQQRRIRKRKWCLFFSLFTIFCLCAAGAVCWYVFVYLREENNGAVEANGQNVGVQMNEAIGGATPPWDPDAPCAEFSINVVTDGYGNETSWELFYSEESFGETSGGVAGTLMQTERKRLRQHASSTNNVGWGQTDRSRRRLTSEPSLVLSQGPFPYLDHTDPTYVEDLSGQYTSSICLPVGHYKFVIYDAKGNGLCCVNGLGDYVLSFKNGREVYMSDGRFGFEEITEFVVAEEDIQTGARTESPSQSGMPTAAPSAAPTGVPRVIPEGVLSASTVTRDYLMAGSITSYGLLFDVVASSNVSLVTIVGLDVLVDATYPVEYEVWSKSGSWRIATGTRNVGAMDAWPDFMAGFQLVSNGTMAGAGLSDLSMIPLDEFRDITIEGGTTHAFWVTLEESSMLFQNYRRSGGGRDDGFDVAMMSFPEFDVMYGSAVMRYPLDTADPLSDFRDYKGFLGKFFYTVDVDDPAPVSLAMAQSGAPSRNPTTSFGDAQSQSPFVSSTQFTSYPPSSKPSIPSQSPSSVSTNTSRFAAPSSLPTGKNGTESPIPINQTSPTVMPANTSNFTTTGNATANASISAGENETETSITYPEPLPIGPSNTSDITLIPNGTSNLTATTAPPFSGNSSSLLSSPSSTPTTSSAPSFISSYNANSTNSSYNATTSTNATANVNETLSTSTASSPLPTNATVTNFSTIAPVDANETSATSSVPTTASASTSSDSSNQAQASSTPATASSNATDATPPVYEPILAYTNSLVIESVHPSSLFGFAIAMSEEGNILAVGAQDATNPAGEATGAVHLYSLNSFIGGQNGGAAPEPFTTIYGQSDGDKFGNSVALSHDGTHLVVGSRTENEVAGSMRVYQLIDNDAVLQGEFPGQSVGERSGWSIAISGNGNVVAVGATKGGASEGGTITSYRAPDWAQYGSVVEGGPGDVAGYSVALSYDGTFMAVGSVKASPTFELRNAGKTDVYAIDGSEWVLRDSIQSSNKGSLDGSAVGLSRDASILVVGSRGYADGTKQLSGRCKIYEWKESQYELLHTIIGQTKREELGISATVSDDGNIIACGGVSGRWSDNIAIESGIVRLWNRSSSQEKAIWPQGDEASVVDDASFGSSLSLSSDGKLVAVGASTWSGADQNSPGAVHIFDTAW